MEGLKAAIALLRLTNDTRAFERCLVTVAAQTGDMQHHIAERRLVRHHEAETLGHVEPFYRSGNLDNLGAFGPCAGPSQARCR